MNYEGTLHFDRLTSFLFAPSYSTLPWALPLAADSPAHVGGVFTVAHTWRGSYK